MAHIDYYFDYASPFTYLADVLIRRTPDAFPVNYRPTYLRGLEYFSKGMPFIASKLGYLAHDLHRCAKHHGVAFAFPEVFPVNGLYALRGALVARREGRFAEYHQRLFDACWAEGKDISNANAVAQLAASVGFEREAFLARMSEPEVKTELRKATDAARERGVFGLPAFFVEDELYWGHDRLDYVRRAVGTAP